MRSEAARPSTLIVWRSEDKRGEVNFWFSSAARIRESRSRSWDGSSTAWTIEKWGPVGAFLGWTVRPEFWDDQSFILVDYLPLRRLIMAGTIEARLKAIADKPSTPAEVRLSMLCPLDAYRAGDVFVFQNAGPINGRWIVTDATRRVLADRHTAFTLAPPVDPTPEPQAQSNPSSTPPVSGRSPPPSRATSGRTSSTGAASGRAPL